MNSVARCPNCNTPLAGRYCHACGQKRLEPQERRFSWFVGQLLKAFTMADSRFFGSIGRLLFRPGSLDRDWLAGRRRRHLAPLSLFLIANLLYFFFPQLTDLNLSLSDQLTGQPHSGLARALVENRLADRGTELAHYAPVYAARATELAKLLVILHAPLTALVLLLLHYRRGVYFVDHLAVALHFWAFTLFIVMALPILLGLLFKLTGLGSALGLQLSVSGLTLLYAWQQLRVAYAQPGWLALVKLLLFLPGLAFAHMIYRSAQFLVAFALS